MTLPRGVGWPVRTGVVAALAAVVLATTSLQPANARPERAAEAVPEEAETTPAVPGPPAPPAGLAGAAPFFHALSVASADASAAWYGRVLGFEEVRRTELADAGITIVLLRRPGAFLELVEADGAVGPGELEPPVERRFLIRGVFKVGFLVDDLDAAQRRLAELEVPLRGRVVTESDGSFRSLQVEDPDGNVLQLFERLDGP